MFADTGVELPAGIGTRSPEDVANAVLRAVWDDPAEIDVAAIEQRFGAVLAALSPALSMRLQAMLGGADVSRAIVEGQARKR
jgi:hypothetical protein